MPTFAGCEVSWWVRQVDMVHAAMHPTLPWRDCNMQWGTAPLTADTSNKWFLV
jgi:hypothetical protein